MPTNKKRIIATFTPQEWIGDNILNLDHKKREEDVTAKILAMSLVEIQALDDDNYNTDELVKHAHNYDGPFKVEVVESTLEFFDISKLDEITQVMLDEAKNQQAEIVTTDEENPIMVKKKTYFIVTADVKSFGQFDPETLREAIAEGISRMRNEGQLTPLGDDTTEVGRITVQFEVDDSKEIIQGLYEALDDASSVVDPGEDETRAYDAVLKRAGSYLGIDSELIRA